MLRWGMSREPPTMRVICCEGCSWVALRVATVMEAAAVAVEHAERSGCEADAVLISRGLSRPVEEGRLH